MEPKQRPKESSIFSRIADGVEMRVGVALFPLLPKWPSFSANGFGIEQIAINKHPESFYSQTPFELYYVHTLLFFELCHGILPLWPGGENVNHSPTRKLTSLDAVSRRVLFLTTFWDGPITGRHSETDLDLGL